ncbi:MAG: hypothetical protein ACR2FX_03060 [Chthoniobacterales bacterium]
MAGSAQPAAENSPANSSPSTAATASPIVVSKSITAVLAREPAGEPSQAFSKETPTIYLRWHGDGLSAGEKIRCIWIAEDVGAAAPANYHVDETSFTADGPNASGTFTLSKPKKGWPEGKYRVEIYAGTQLAATLAFSIEALRGD